MPNRWSLFSRRMSVHPSARPSQKQIRATTDTMHENNDHRLVGTWWVTLKSPTCSIFLAGQKSSFLLLTILFVRGKMSFRYQKSHDIVSFYISLLKLSQNREKIAVAEDHNRIGMSNLTTSKNLKVLMFI